MEISPELLDRARRYKPDAVAEIVQACYPAIYRIAYGIAGREDVGRGVVRFVVKRGLHAMPKWEDEQAPMRWYSHHTILTARRAVKYPPAAKDDVLVRHAGIDSPAYVAFVRGVRTLPIQQKEAFILHHGEKLPHRQLAIAMDCSVEAAKNHLNAATSALRTVAGAAFDDYCERLAGAYQELSPSDEISVPAIQQFVRRHVWPRRIWRFVRVILMLAFLAAFAWAAWHIGRLLDI